jgi:hypothetical protein
MRALSCLVGALLCVALLGAAAPAPARASLGSQAADSVVLARVGVGRSFRVPRTSRYRTRSPYYRRRSRSTRAVAGGILRALGLAYLFHALFGWGGGGSPFGLLLLAAIVLFLATRRRRRRVPSY